MRGDKAVKEWLSEHMSVEGKVTDSNIALEGVITISKVESLHHQLEEAIQLGGNVTFDAGDCERVDTSVLQLLTCFMSEAKEKEIKVSWQGASDSFKNAMKLLGVHDYLSLDAT